MSVSECWITLFLLSCRCDWSHTYFFQAHQLSWNVGKGCLGRKSILLQDGHGMRLQLNQGGVLTVFRVHYLQDILATLDGVYEEVLVIVAWKRADFWCRQSKEPLHHLSHLRLAEVGLGVFHWHYCWMKTTWYHKNDADIWEIKALQLLVQNSKCITI